MNLSLVALAIFAIAVMVVGLIEWLKGWPVWQDPVKNPKGPAFPSWIPSAASPVLCLILGQLLAPIVLVGIALAWVWGIALALLALAVTEFCYQLIIQSIPQILQGAISRVAPSSVAALQPPTPAVSQVPGLAAAPVAPAPGGAP